MVCAAVVLLSNTCLRGQECQPDAPLGFSISARGAADVEGGAVLDVFLAANETFSLDVTVLLANSSGEDRAMEACAGLFAMSVAHDPKILGIDEMTFEGTDYGSIVTLGDDLIRAASNGEAAGFVTEDPLCLVPSRFVLDRAMSVVRAQYAIEMPFDVGQVGEIVTTEIRFLDGLKAQNGLPVANWVTMAGGRVRPCTRNLTIRFHIVEGAMFIRCDANNDGRLSIADAVWILNELFLGGAQTKCPIAADCDGNGQRNITDAVFGLMHLFLGGQPPPAPYPSCGRIDISVEECPAQSTSCL